MWLGTFNLIFFTKSDVSFSTTYIRPRKPNVSLTKGVNESSMQRSPSTMIVSDR